MAQTRRTDDLSILNAIAEELNRTVDVGEALDRTLALVTELLRLSTGWIWLLDPDTDRFYKAAAHNLPPYLQDPVRMAGSWCTCTEEFRDGDLAAKNIDVIECSRLKPAVEKNLTDLTQGLRFHASIPLHFQDKPLGIMNLTGPSWRRLTKDELRLLSMIGYQIGITVERARLAEESARLARAEERTRIAREIHDTLAQGLTAIALQIEAALQRLEGPAVEARERLGRALDIARDNLEDARRSVLALRSSPPARGPLGEALTALARGFTSETGVRVRVRRSGNGVLPATFEDELFRIASESLANVRKHARATEVVMTLQVRLRDVRVTVTDNGRGFQADPAPGNAAGQGILGMRERARLIGGDLRIDSAPGKGTTVTVSAKLPEAGSRA
jgi:two-component system, NarL family, sensor kinase